VENLTLPLFKEAVKDFVIELNKTPIAQLYGITDGKAVGTYVEQSFHQYLSIRYAYQPGSSASGIDFPELEVDLKVTSNKQPQSSCPFRDASQKVYGLGYHLLVLVYEKTDDRDLQSAHLTIISVVFVDRQATGDYQTTYGLREIIRRHGNRDDIIAFLEERNLPLDEIGRELLSERILNNPPKQGFITISNALQWRLQYRRIIELADRGNTPGIENLM
jgi:hypothetical protein